MEISFAGAKLESICGQQKLAIKAIGAQSAKKLQLRLAELFAAESVKDLVAGRPHPLTKDRMGQFAVDLYGGHRLIFQPTRQPPPMLPDGGMDWSSVTEVTIIEIGDYHD